MKLFFSNTQLAHQPTQYMVHGRIVDPFENPNRATTLIESLQTCGLERAEPKDFGRGPILKVHADHYIAFLEEAYARFMELPSHGPEVLPNVHPYRGASPAYADRGRPRVTGIIGRAGWYMGDLSCATMEGTFRAAYASAQTAIAGAEEVLAGAPAAFSLCRPPGHHAYADRCSGFCYLNNAAIAAEVLRRKFARVAIVDFDTHHGDGTQAIFYARADVLYGSVHTDPSAYYPHFAGYADEAGTGAGCGANLNLPLPWGADDAAFIAANARLAEAVTAHDSEALVLSAGWDAHRDDPLSKLAVSTDAYARIGELYGRLGLPTLIVQEGGYSLPAIAAASRAFIGAFRAAHSMRADARHALRCAGAGGYVWQTQFLRTHTSSPRHRTMQPLDRIKAFHDEMTAWRQDLHAHPELGFEERRTSEFVAAKLAEFGCTVHRNIGKTGVVGVLQRGNGPAIGLRADMDALPIEEATDLPYKSRHAGRMHACGHDGHTTMLLGAARYLAETKNFDGTVHFIFQPAEEGLGGAKAMLEEGLFERFPCDAVFGMHNTPGLAIGKFAIRPGPMMAGGAFFDIAVAGRGSHGARPESGIDPVLAACHITTGLQAIVARNISPTDTAVVSVTAIHAGDAYNVIPQTAALRGTVRTFRAGTMQQIEEAMRRTVKGIAAGLGASADIDFRTLFAPLVNDPRETEFMADAATDLVGPEHVNRNRSSVMASEDFAYMLEARPGAYINIGNGEEGRGSCPVHNPGYDFNDAALPLGASLYAHIVEKKLPRLRP